MEEWGKAPRGAGAQEDAYGETPETSVAEHSWMKRDKMVSLVNHNAWPHSFVVSDESAGMAKRRSLLLRLL
jgi:hypothetical protein